MLSLTNSTEIDSNPELFIRVKADKENKILHIIDSGIGMTKEDLETNLGTIAKSGTADFLSKVQETETGANDMIGQFGVGFYSAFLVADRVVVTSKHNADVQRIWESDASSFSIIEDPRGDTLKRGSQISLYLKDEAVDFLEDDTIKGLIKKYSQFINFPIYVWSSTTVDEEIPIEEEKPEKPEKSEDDVVEDGDEDAKVRGRFILSWEMIDSIELWGCMYPFEGFIIGFVYKSMNLNASATLNARFENCGSMIARSYCFILFCFQAQPHAIISG